MSAGSRTDVGAYHRHDSEATNAKLGDLTGQFSLMDHRPAHEIVKDLMRKGYVPSWWGERGWEAEGGRGGLVGRGPCGRAAPAPACAPRLEPPCRTRQPARCGAPLSPARSPP
jgi:hypothetical protein